MKLSFVPPVRPAELAGAAEARGLCNRGDGHRLLMTEQVFGVIRSAIANQLRPRYDEAHGKCSRSLWPIPEQLGVLE